MDFNNNKGIKSIWNTSEGFFCTKNKAEMAQKQFCIIAKILKTEINVFL